MLIEALRVDQALLDLLQNCALQISDISDDQTIAFFGISPKNTLQASIGLESLPGCGLLRSLAVADSYRGLGYAQRLVAYAEHVAKSQGIGALYLLTETADRFFEKQGYQRIDRNTAPEAVKSTEQYTSLCADTCAILTKSL